MTRVVKNGQEENLSAGGLEELMKNHPLGRPLVGVVFYNNGESVPLLLARFPRWAGIDVVFHDDASSDGTPDILEKSGFTVLRKTVNGGLGRAIKNIIEHAHKTNHQVVVIMAGNNKDDPNEVPRLLAPIYQDGKDYVQGSRMLHGGSSPSIPLFRRLMVPVHALVMSGFTGFRCTDALNGFRAYKIGMFYDNPHFNIWQEWLDHYELETYVHYNVLRRGYRVAEVPVTKSYVHFKDGMKHSHIRPFHDWWGILRPLLFLRLGIRK